MRLPRDVFVIPDAAGLALFAVLGTEKALVLNAPWLVASLMGLITGVFGGVLRDVFCNEVPLIFTGELYATAVWSGTLLFVLLAWLGVDAWTASLAAIAFIFVVRPLAYARLKSPAGLPLPAIDECEEVRYSRQEHS